MLPLKGFSNKYLLFSKPCWWLIFLESCNRPNGFSFLILIVYLFFNIFHFRPSNLTCKVDAGFFKSVFSPNSNFLHWFYPLIKNTPTHRAIFLNVFDFLTIPFIIGRNIALSFYFAPCSSFFFLFMINETLSYATPVVCAFQFMTICHTW